MLQEPKTILTFYGKHILNFKIKSNRPFIEIIEFIRHFWFFSRTQKKKKNCSYSLQENLIEQDCYEINDLSIPKVYYR